MWLMKTLLTSGCTNQRGAGHPLGDLADGLFLKFRGKTWCAHRLLLCSNYRADLSTGSGSLQY
ncbi:TPA: hypothetical protein MH347_25520 [Klebsiella pneumoniae]|nr:hypothetical protein [Klebsiella pneumoniae]HBX4973948.1 hypothetical protein [Klebsiella pneumoniae]HBX4989884.1 hypothetical protein [Klebsiella pneumoniae]